MTLLQLVREHWVHILVPMGFAFGYYLDRKDDEKLTAFRNKSMLFQRELRPNEEGKGRREQTRGDSARVRRKR